MRDGFAIDPIATTGRVFRDFRPYVAAISEDGVVHFQAALDDGTTSVFAGARVLVRSATHGIAAVRSHPDVDAHGRWCAYVELEDGREAVVLGEGYSVRRVAQTGGELAHIGPLGPTMNQTGAIAFRATTARGEGVFLAHDDRVVALELVGARAFHGLPIVRGDGSVVVRVDDGEGAAIYVLREGAAAEKVVGAPFTELGPFVSANDRGSIAFRGAASEPGVFVFDGNAARPVVAGTDVFESYRGALINDLGTVIFYATPIGGALGVYVAHGEAVERVMGVGDRLLGSTVRGLALNPVSFNDRDELAVRVECDDVQHIAYARV